MSAHEAHNAPLTIVIALLCFAVAGHRLPQLARELVADENEKATSRPKNAGSTKVME